MITHDLTSITYFCDRVLFPQEGRIKATAKMDELTSIDGVFDKISELENE